MDMETCVIERKNIKENIFQFGIQMWNRKYANDQ